MPDIGWLGRRQRMSLLHEAASLAQWDVKSDYEPWEPATAECVPYDLFSFAEWLEQQAVRHAGFVAAVEAHGYDSGTTGPLADAAVSIQAAADAVRAAHRAATAQWDASPDPYTVRGV